MRHNRLCLLFQGLGPDKPGSWIGFSVRQLPEGKTHAQNALRQGIAPVLKHIHTPLPYMGKKGGQGLSIVYNQLLLLLFGQRVRAKLDPFR